MIYQACVNAKTASIYVLTSALSRLPGGEDLIPKNAPATILVQVDKLLPIAASAMKSTGKTVKKPKSD